MTRIRDRQPGTYAETATTASASSSLKRRWVRRARTATVTVLGVTTLLGKKAQAAEPNWQPQPGCEVDASDSPSVLRDLFHNGTGPIAPALDVLTARADSQGRATADRIADAGAIDLLVKAMSVERDPAWIPLAERGVEVLGRLAVAETEACAKAWMQGKIDVVSQTIADGEAHQDEAAGDPPRQVPAGTYVVGISDAGEPTTHFGAHTINQIVTLEALVEEARAFVLAYQPPVPVASSFDPVTFRTVYAETDASLLAARLHEASAVLSAEVRLDLSAKLRPRTTEAYRIAADELTADTDVSAGLQESLAWVDNLVAWEHARQDALRLYEALATPPADEREATLFLVHFNRFRHFELPSWADFSHRVDLWQSRLFQFRPLTSAERDALGRVFDEGRALVFEFAKTDGVTGLTLGAPPSVLPTVQLGPQGLAIADLEQRFGQAFGARLRAVDDGDGIVSEAEAILALSAPEMLALRAWRNGPDFGITPAPGPQPGAGGPAPIGASVATFGNWLSPLGYLSESPQFLALQLTNVVPGAAIYARNLSPEAPSSFVRLPTHTEAHTRPDGAYDLLLGPAIVESLRLRAGDQLELFVSLNGQTSDPTVVTVNAGAVGSGQVTSVGLIHPDDPGAHLATLDALGYGEGGDPLLSLPEAEFHAVSDATARLAPPQPPLTAVGIGNGGSLRGFGSIDPGYVYARASLPVGMDEPGRYFASRTRAVVDDVQRLITVRVGSEPDYSSEQRTSTRATAGFNVRLLHNTEYHIEVRDFADHLVGQARVNTAELAEYFQANIEVLWSLQPVPQY